MIETMIVIGILPTMVILWFWKDLRDAKRQVKELELQLEEYHEGKGQESPFNSRELMLKTLEKMGIGYEIHKENENCFLITYQGVDFLIYASESSAYVNPVLPYFHTLPMDNTEAIVAAKEAVNDYNRRTIDTVVSYSINKENDCFHLHCGKTILFIPEIPKIENYLHAVLEDLFHTKNQFMSELHEVLANVPDTEDTDEENAGKHLWPLGRDPKKGELPS